MAIVKWPEKMLGIRIHGKLGEPYMEDPMGINGIYRVWRRWGRVQNLKETFYVPTNPRTEAQQAIREKYGQAVGAWRLLTQEQKNAYNKRAKNRPYSGYNLFVKEYMHG